MRPSLFLEKYFILLGFIATAIFVLMPSGEDLHLYTTNKMRRIQEKETHVVEETVLQQEESDIGRNLLGNCCTLADCEGCSDGEVDQSVCEEVGGYVSFCDGGYRGFRCPPGQCVPLSSDPGGFPDPHFTMWGGKKFSYHGACDLVYLKCSVFGLGKGLSMHIRTNLMPAGWSSISNIAVRIGNDTLEVADDNTYYLNGKANTTIPTTFASDYTITKETKEVKKIIHGKNTHNIFTVYTVELGNHQWIKLVAWNHHKDLWSLSFKLRGHNKEDFSDSSGLIGPFGDQQGKMLCRDRKIDFTGKTNLFGQEWQVREHEPMLFRTKVAPQHPEQCLVAPKGSAEKRLLKAKTDNGGEHYRHAKEACGHLRDYNKEYCVFDVIMTGDTIWAQAPHYNDMY